MRTRLFATMLGLAICASIAIPLRAQSGNELFQQALAKERADGKLGEAIALYQRIVKENAGNRSLAAKALVQLGRAYERLGQTEARSAYERVLREYADQGDAAREARDRMRILAGGGVLQQGASREASARKLFESSVLSSAAVTADGRSIVFVDSTGNLAVMAIATRSVRSLTRSTADDEYADYFAVAPDGQRVAYAWWNGPSTQWELRVVDRNGQVKVLIADSTVDFARPFGFTRDGKSILAAVTHGSGPIPGDLAFINVADGSRRRLMDYVDRTVATLSPDDRYVVYDALADSAAKTHDLRVFTIATGRDAPLVEHPADDLAPMWHPGGDGVFFISTRNGARNGWFVPMSDGRATSTPVLVRAAVGNGTQLGLTRDGALYYTPTRAYRQDIYVAEIDPASGSYRKAPSLVLSRTNGNNTAPAWSRDGKFLVSIGGPPRAVRVRNMQTNTEQELRIPLEGFEVPQLTPDNQAVIVTGLRDARKAVVGIYRVELSTGQLRVLLEKPGNLFSIRNPLPSADGKFVYYLWSSSRFGTSVMQLDLTTGEDRALYEVSDAVADRMALSADGQWLAFREAPLRGSQRLKIVAVTGSSQGTVKTLGVLPSSAGSLSWTADGRSLLALSGSRGLHELWSIPADGSAPRKLRDLDMRVIRSALSPDGRTFAMRVDDQTSELWVAENFLPRADGRAKP
jgi:Tol biopolymer transport system component